MSVIHPQDQKRIEQLHFSASSSISADIDERLISLQDASYELGRQRGMAEGKEQRDELLEALNRIAQLTYDSQAIRVSRSAIAKVTGDQP